VYKRTQLSSMVTPTNTTDGGVTSSACEGRGCWVRRFEPCLRCRVRNNLEGIACKCLQRYMLLPVPLLNWHLLIELETAFHASMFKGGGRAENRQDPLSYWHHLLRLFTPHPAIPRNKAARGRNKTDLALTHSLSFLRLKSLLSQAF